MPEMFCKYTRKPAYTCFPKTSYPIGKPIATLCLLGSKDERPASIAIAGPLAKRESDVFAKSRAGVCRATSVEPLGPKQGHSRSEWSDLETGESASSLARESDSEAPLGLPKHSPAPLLHPCISESSVVINPPAVKRLTSGMVSWGEEIPTLSGNFIDQSTRSRFPEAKQVHIKYHGRLLQSLA